VDCPDGKEDVKILFILMHTTAEVISVGGNDIQVLSHVLDHVIYCLGREMMLNVIWQP